MKRALIVTAAAAPLCMAMSAQAATITGWSLINVVPGPVGVEGASVIYNAPLAAADTPAAGSVSNGRVAYAPPEADSPGMEILNDPLATSSGGSSIPLQGCIIASSTADCNSGFQSGKRFKNQITGTGPVDFVFDVDPTTGGTDPYQVYHRLVNQTGLDLAGFTISLGTGIGDQFQLSGAGDGLGFSTSFVATGGVGGATQASSQFPFGLFGDAASNPNFTLDGFFAAERTGFTMSFSEDVLASAGLAGPYPSLFGPWMSQEVVPAGAFFDFDSDAATDDLLLAWLNFDGKWELRREVTAFDALTFTDGIDGNEVLTVESLLAPVEFGSFAELLASLDPAVAALLGDDVIEDLANLNVNYAISVAGFAGSQFTLRVDVAPVPLPMAAPLLMAGLGGLTVVGRRRKAQAAG